MGLFSKTARSQATPETSPNPLISTYTHLSFFEHADEALKLLHRLASMVKPIMRKRNWKVETLAEFYPDFQHLQGLNTGQGRVINIRLRPAWDKNTFYGVEMLMDTMLHELCHNVHMDHNDQFYELLDQVKRDWEVLSSKGYQGEGFFSPGQRLGSGHVFYKPNTDVATTAADRRRIKDVVERSGKGIIVGTEGRRVGGQDVPVQREIPVTAGRRLGEGGEAITHDLDPRQLAAMAAVQRAKDLKARDQKRCGAKQPGVDMRREYERAQSQSTTTLAKDIRKVVEVDDMKMYDLEDIPRVRDSSSTTDGFRPSMNSFQSDWACEACTFLNPPLYLSCQICQAERKLGDTLELIDIPDEFAVSWDCQVCTFKNENVKEGKCVICGTEI